MKFLITLFLFIPFLAQAKMNCTKNGKFRFHRGGKEVIENASYCFDGEDFSLLSLNCYPDENCIAVQKTDLQVPEEKLQGQFGSPGFKLCYIYGGKPQLLDIWSGKKWVKMDRCLFEADQSFVDIPSLLDFMREED